jgi:hypothetical protein
LFILNEAKNEVDFLANINYYNKDKDKDKNKSKFYNQLVISYLCSRLGVEKGLGMYIVHEFIIKPFYFYLKNFKVQSAKINIYGANLKLNDFYFEKFSENYNNVERNSLGVIIIYNKNKKFFKNKTNNRFIGKLYNIFKYIKN